MKTERSVMTEKKQKKNSQTVQTEYSKLSSGSNHFEKNIFTFYFY